MRGRATPTKLPEMDEIDTVETAVGAWNELHWPRTLLPGIRGGFSLSIIVRTERLRAENTRRIDLRRGYLKT
jgi:hypothetical protein